MVRACLTLLLASFVALVVAGCEDEPGTAGDTVDTPGGAVPAAADPVATPPPTAAAPARTPTPVAASAMPTATATPARREDAVAAPPATATPAPREYDIGAHGGTLTTATTSKPETFNPALVVSGYSQRLLRLVFDGLISTSRRTGQIELALARNFEWSSDYRWWIFHLRDDVRWHDGTPFTARDVEFTFNRVIYNQDIASPYREPFLVRFVDDAGAPRSEPITVSLIDEYTVRFDLPAPFRAFPLYMSTPIYPRHILEPHVDAGTFEEVWGIDADPSTVVGTGPFKLDRFVPGDRVVLRRNPDYWLRDAAGNALPYLDGIVHLLVPTEAERLARFRAGKTDAYGLIGADYATLAPHQQAGNYTLHTLGPDEGMEFLVFNLNPGSDARSGEPYVAPERLAWFQTLEFRRAVAHSIDKDRIIAEAHGGAGSPLWAAFSPAFHEVHNPDVRRYPYDVDVANEILDGLSWRDRDGDGVREDSDGNPITFTLRTYSGYPAVRITAEIIDEGLDGIGVDARLEVLEFEDLLARLTSTYDWEAALLYVDAGVDPHTGLNFFHSSGDLHVWHPNQPSPATDWEAEIDRLYIEAGQVLNREGRAGLYHRVQAIMAEQLPLIFTVLSDEVTAVRNVFGNVEPTGYGLWDIRYLYRTSIK
ncbi:MAG: ABC transporter substrate-binding protein [Chloroflexi bacterium]|nr:ABC transporter substrate-binding protein [Chloroflexota bacterium]